MKPAKNAASRRKAERAPKSLAPARQRRRGDAPPPARRCDSPITLPVPGPLDELGEGAGQARPAATLARQRRVEQVASPTEGDHAGQKIDGHGDGPRHLSPVQGLHGAESATAGAGPVASKSAVVATAARDR
jgi:hypothetical protein